jgi:hypothetical protein
MAARPLPRAARAISAASRAVRASGFSHKTALPARSAAMLGAACRSFGCRVDQHVDLGIGGEGLPLRHGPRGTVPPDRLLERLTRPPAQRDEPASGKISAWRRTAVRCAFATPV